MAVVITEERIGLIHKVKFAWTSDASGDAAGATDGYYTGEIVRAVQIPSGVAAPTAAFDVVVTDSDGADALVGLGANLSESAVTSKTTKDGLGAIANTQLTLSVSNAGDTKSGITILFIKVW